MALSQEETREERLRGRAPKARRDMKAADFYVPMSSLPDFVPHPATPQLQMWAGHIPSDPKAQDTSDAHLFFALQKSRHIADRERLMIWFNGGPGCSSMDGLMMENGAFRMFVGDEGNIGIKEVPPGSAWNEYTHMLFLDQPIGTGLSYANTDSYLRDLPEAAEQVVKFLKTFYKIFPEMASLDLYLAGESFAGQYIPYIARAFIDDKELKPLLKGVAIGNGWIDPKTQSQSYLDFAYENGLVKEGSATADKVIEQLAKCNEHLEKEVKINDPACEGLATMISADFRQEVNGQSLCMNIYDLRLMDTYPACGMNWPPEVSHVQTYLRKQEVINALHATAKSTAYEECNYRVSQVMNLQNTQPSIAMLPALLEDINILIFGGDKDIICNTLGLSRMVNNLEWSGAKGFGDVSKEDWLVNDENVGTWLTARNLSYVEIYNASHMVPYDAPQVTLNMMHRFMDVRYSVGNPDATGSPKGDIVDPVSPVPPVLDDSTQGSKQKDGSESESVYNAGSALLIILILLAGIGALFYFKRSKSPGSRRLRSHDDGREEERIGLTSSLGTELLQRSSHGSRQNKPLTPIQEHQSDVFVLEDDDLGTPRM